MALVRVYCGIASTAPEVDAGDNLAAAVNRLTVAVVDDSGRLLEFCVINDDPAGYALVTSLLAERFGGSTMVTVAADSDDQQVISLLAAAGRAIAYTDDESADDFADRFADDESLDEANSSPDERRAVGLARALQAGALSAVVGPAPREFVAFKPVLAAHAALAVGRHAAAVALREVLRELYPAALRAYPDPAAPVALAVLEALPEPGMLAGQSGSRNRDNGATAETVAARLVADGVCDSGTALEAVTALRVAIAETPRRNGIGKQLTAAVADSVRHSVAAVRSSDAAGAALIDTLADRMAPPPVAAPAQPAARRTGVPVTSAPPAMAAATGARRRVQPTAVNAAPAQPRPVQAPPTAPEPVSSTPLAPPPVDRPAWAPSTPPVPPGFEPTPIAGTPMVAMPVAARQEAPAAPTRQMPTPIPPRQAPIPAQRTSRPPADAGKPFVPTLTNAVISGERAARGFNQAPSADLPDETVEQGHLGYQQPAADLAEQAPRGYQQPAEPVDDAPRGYQQLAADLPSDRADRAPRGGYQQPAEPANDRAPRGGYQQPAEPMNDRGHRGGYQQPVEPANDRGPRGGYQQPAVDRAGDLDDRAQRGYQPSAAERLANELAERARSGFQQDSLRDTGERPRFNAPSATDVPIDITRMPADPLGMAPQQPAAPAGSRANWPLNPEPEEPARPADGRITPPWLDDDLVLPESPSLRLVDESARRNGRGGREEPPLRLVDDSALTGARPKPRRSERASSPASGEDDDLLIFASVSSAWFSGPETSAETTWNSTMDSGWRAAEQAARPQVGNDTTAGLPRRVPAANLVPGSTPEREERPLRIVRDAAGIAAHTSNYFRGWRRGNQELGGGPGQGGFAVGGRPGRESANGWDFSREQDARDDRDDYNYRAANYR
ncbi:transposase [Catellatospora sichuanensis]|uniref:transposase n=1 Tax=Catellatospora sichuanensis TaxID=1969805 RepID=UPI001182BAFB|nr:transposase [Catellatospora sichuanensis]